MLNCHGLLRIPNQHKLAKSKWKDGFYLSFKAFSTTEDKQHYYQCNMFVPKEEIDKWETNIRKGAIFLLKDAEISSFTKEDWSNSIYTIKIRRHNFKLLKVKPIGESGESV